MSPRLIERHVRESALLERAYKLLESDLEVQELLRMANIFAVHRLRYNDHGPVHARITAGAALELLDALVSSGVKPSCIRDGTCLDLEDAKLIVLVAAYLHDIGNAVHRHEHEFIGALLAKPILDRLLPEILADRARENPRLVYSIRQEIMHAIYCTAPDVECLTVEGGVVKIADGLDMAEGRARIPYKLGKVDIHAVSALSIKKVEIVRGSERPVRIVVHMDEWAGIFQVEKVLLPKVLKSGLHNYIEIVAMSRGKEVLTYPERER